MWSSRVLRRQIVGLRASEARGRFVGTEGNTQSAGVEGEGAEERKSWA